MAVRVADTHHTCNFIYGHAVFSPEIKSKAALLFNQIIIHLFLRFDHVSTAALKLNSCSIEKAAKISVSGSDFMKGRYILV